MKEWSYRDFYSLPILGPIIALFSKFCDNLPVRPIWVSKKIAVEKFSAHPLLHQITDKIFAEYDRLDQDLQGNSY